MEKSSCVPQSGEKTLERERERVEKKKLQTTGYKRSKEKEKINLKSEEWTKLLRNLKQGR